MLSNNQSSIFIQGEGDHWFERNRRALEGLSYKKDLPCRLIEMYSLRPKKILEVGCANGYRLSWLSRRWGARAMGIEVSPKAIRDGKRAYPRVRFRRGVISQIPTREKFDLVIVNFVLHWVDRALLLPSVSEIDRVVEDGGFLVLGDFFPDNRIRVAYHHLPNQGVFTYKQNYADIFLSSGLYGLKALLTADHSTRGLTACSPEQGRTGTCLLQKNSTAGYVSGYFPSTKGVAE